MKVINLFGGPGAGKSTLAAYLYCRLKQDGYRTELVGEEAREIIYSHQVSSFPRQLKNQFLVAARQYERLKRLEDHGVEIAVSDSPLILSKVYGKRLPYVDYLADLIHKVNQEFENYNIFVNRNIGVYDKESRSQTLQEARDLDYQILSILNLDLYHVAYWNDNDTTYSGIKKWVSLEEKK